MQKTMAGVFASEIKEDLENPFTGTQRKGASVVYKSHWVCLC